MKKPSAELLQQAHDLIAELKAAEKYTLALQKLEDYLNHKRDKADPAVLRRLLLQAKK